MNTQFISRISPAHSGLNAIQAIESRSRYQRELMNIGEDWNTDWWFFMRLKQELKRNKQSSGL